MGGGVSVGTRRTVAAEARNPAAMSSRESPTCGGGEGWCSRYECYLVIEDKQKKNIP